MPISTTADIRRYKPPALNGRQWVVSEVIEYMDAALGWTCQQKLGTLL